MGSRGHAPSGLWSLTAGFVATADDRSGYLEHMITLVCAAPNVIGALGAVSYCLIWMTGRENARDDEGHWEGSADDAAELLIEGGARPEGRGPHAQAEPRPVAGRARRDPGRAGQGSGDTGARLGDSQGRSELTGADASEQPPAERKEPKKPRASGAAKGKQGTKGKGRKAAKPAKPAKPTKAAKRAEAAKRAKPAKPVEPAAAVETDEDELSTQDELSAGIEHALKFRLENIEPVEQPLALICQAPRSGGTLLAGCSTAIRRATPIRTSC